MIKKKRRTLQCSWENCGVLIVQKILYTGIINSNLAFEKRLKLFVAMLPYIGQDEACKYLSALNLHEYVRIFDSHSKPKFEISQQSESILDAFKQKGWIFEYVEDETRPSYYRIRRREPRKK